MSKDVVHVVRWFQFWWSKVIFLGYCCKPTQRLVSIFFVILRVRRVQILNFNFTFFLNLKCRRHYSKHKYLYYTPQNHSTMTTYKILLISVRRRPVCSKFICLQCSKAEIKTPTLIILSFPIGLCYKIHFVYMSL